MFERLEVVTVDGPAGGGKSTVSRALASRLRFTYLDTGAMYRAVAYKCKISGVAVDDVAMVAQVVEKLNITLLPPETPEDDILVRVDNEEVGMLLRTPEMGMLASTVSAHPVVRNKLTRMQQEMGARGKVVAEGRDTGTVVFPGAAWKFYLDAGPVERAKRRAIQLRSKGEPADEEQLLIQISKRDRDDSQRDIAPLKAAPDALHVDSTHLSVAEVIDTMLSHIYSTPL